MLTRRRDFLRALGAIGLSTLHAHAHSDDAEGHPDEHVAWPSGLDDLCSAGPNARPLFVPGDRGFLGRLKPPDDVLPLRAASLPAEFLNPLAGFTQGYLLSHDGRRYCNPTLVLQPGQRVRVDFLNTLGESTIVHWHGLAVDTKNDGGGMSVIKTGERYAYDFEVRDRGALYWYHPHPHGLTGGQLYRGLFGMIEVEDDDERNLRSALDVSPGKTEIPLVLQDRRSESYEASDSAQMHGFLGNAVFINGTPCAYLDVATRAYRFRVLNASNARTYRLGFRTADGKSMPFTLLGTDAGLLAAPRRCDEAFIASAERLDLLMDLSDLSVGDTLTLDTRAFDPMHQEMGVSAMSQTDHAAMGHTMPMERSSQPTTSGADHATIGHGGSFPEGAARGLLQLRVRERTPYRMRLPTTLSTVALIDTTSATERPLRLGFAKGRWRINDRVFVMGETPIEVKRDSVETWLIRNYFNSMPHAMHLHGFHFQVIERETSPDQIAALKVDDHGRFETDFGWKDTILVWPGESVRIAIDFRLPKTSAFGGPQTYMFHCHNLEHEDGGMMLGVKVA
jgi:suppressor of ftsI/bilirubin oxidase